MYNHKLVLNKTKKGSNIIKFLFDTIKKKPYMYIKRNKLNGKKKERSICDFIAGMTDRYAINLYNSLK